MIKLEHPDNTLKDILIDMLRHKNPKFVDAEKLGKSTRNIEEYICFFYFDGAGSLYIHRGVRRTLYSLLIQLGIKAKINDQRNIGTVPYIGGDEIQYRPYQLPAVNGLLSAGPEGVLVAPPGSGKTVMGLSLLPILQQPALWLTHTDNLFKQCYARCREFLPDISEEDIGLIGGGKWSVGKTFTIAMIPTLVRNLAKLGELKDRFGLLILDEAHHCPASTFHKVVTSLNPYYLYGLTATPYRRDGLETMLFQCIGSVGHEISKDEVAKYKGIIAPTILYCGLNYGPRVEISTPSTIFNEHIIFNEKRNMRIRDDVVREAKMNNYCIISSGRKAHCEILYKLIKERWPKTGIATGKYSKKLIDEQIEAFNNKEITVLVTTPELLGEGFDVDFLNRLFVTTSFRTESRAEQLIGRVQRFHPDKKDSLVYEYVDENIGVFQNQFYSQHGKCRSNVYRKLGLNIIDYHEYHV